jgi:D-aminopeptidase
MVIIATDAPLDARLLGRMARRGGLGMARTGFYSASGSGDFFIAFTTANPVPHDPECQDLGRGTPSADKLKGPPLIHRQVLPDEAMSPLFAAQADAIEEAIINSLFAAETMTGRDGNTREALPIEETLGLLKLHRALR